MKKYIVSSFVATIFLLNGCGGSDGVRVNEHIGYYIDSGIVGVDYVCGTKQGKTGKGGRFEFDSGKGCEFSLADIPLREVDAENLFTRVKIIEKQPEVAAFLQSLDFDGNAANDIEISPKVVQELRSKKIQSIPEGTALENIIDDLKTKIGEFKGKVVTPNEAVKHLRKSQESLIVELLSKKTLYSVYTDTDDNTNEIVVIEKVTFNSNVTQGSSQRIKGGDDSGTFTTSIDGNKIIITDEDGTDTIVFKAYNDKYIEFYEESEDDSDTIKLYRSKKDALEKAAQLEQSLHHQSGASGSSK